MKLRTLLFTILAALAFSGGASGQGLDYHQFGLLAIQDAGRRKPVDTFARESLMRISGGATYTGTGGKTWTAPDFLLSVLFNTHDWKKEPLVLIPYHPLAAKLGLDVTRKRFSLEELGGASILPSLLQQGQELKQQEKEIPRELKEAESLATRMEALGHLMDNSAFTIVPPPAGSASDRWTVPTPDNPDYNQGQYKEAMDQLAQMAQAYTGNDGFDFSVHSALLRKALRALNPAVYPTDSMLQLEYRYNHLRAFAWAATLYAVAFILLLVANARKGRPKFLTIAGLTLATAGLVLQAGGIAMRCIIAGRPPVTNMYESVVWVSFGIMAFAFIFLLRYRALTYLLAALPVSLTCLLLVQQLPVAMPENIDPLVPVLRSNYWLTIHVLTITLSYAAFGLAMGFGHIVLYRFIRNPVNAARDETLHFWLYRILQLGVLLLATGTILGGVWANYSWGRFWGWDPKETWALIALLCYIFVLHGRIVGWWDHFGLALASVVCFCAVVMTWYGVNFVLGKGLHSYGFGIGGEKYVSALVCVDLVYVAFAAWRYRKIAPRLAELELEDIPEDEASAV
ncbi:MAG TPA: cytochrome c biogenesis protein CcsA [Chthoniobacteraceae bacterium]|jgi:cytochrome c-type biogenesis protein CcsB|nr:cytochrome c biogenesis protein CcsA [Chthoniobacteraceae bacterium]